MGDVVDSLLAALGLWLVFEGAGMALYTVTSKHQFGLVSAWFARHD